LHATLAANEDLVVTYTAALLTLALIGASATVAKAECRDCAPPGRHYDSIEVIRTVREVDHSRVIDTRSEVMTRVRVVAPMPVVKTVEIVVRRYRVIEVPNTSYVSVVSYPVNRYHRIRHSRWLRVRG
jgi:hypothetical protein